ncbi:para-nitrobenzyl esterase (plasmid) [Arthrobacter sp. StoSoilB3]|nr:para-nitrobenzyl esterase [Arthrobacter sp. StoSoilB3]
MTTTSTDRTAVLTSTGPVIGNILSGVREFLGIPYAEDPIGPLRLAQPRPPAHWKDPLDATRPGPAAPQAPSRLESVMGRPGGEVAEAGCLNINVWAPLAATDLPVLFWVHGGALTSGSGAWNWYSGSHLAAEHGIVVVTFNYRLGPLGFLDPTELTNHLGPQNLGLLDAILALEWTADNIAAFGGNPDLITVGGQSSGATIAALLAANEQTKRHVRRIIMQSGTPDDPIPTQTESTRAAAEFFRILGVHPEDTNTIRALPADHLIAANRELIRRLGGPIDLPIGLVRSAQAPWANVRAAICDAVSPEIGILMGTTSDEGHAFVSIETQTTETDAITELDTLSNGRGLSLYRKYEALRPQGPPQSRVADYFTDTLFRSPTHQLAQDRAELGKPAYVYEFAWSASQLGAAHCIELPFLFGNREAWADAPMLDGIDNAEFQDLSTAFAGAFASFVRTGNPHHQALPAWPTYEATHRSVLRFDSKIKAVSAQTKAHGGNNIKIRC